MQTQQSSISAWTIPSTPEQRKYFSVHAPKLKIYGIVATITQILWLAVSYIACKSIYDWAFERVPDLQFLAAPLAVVTLVTLHVLLRTTYEVFWFDRLDGRTETDSSPVIPLLILVAMVALDYQGARVYLEGNVKPPTITTTAETDTRHRQEVDAAKADYTAAKGEAVAIAKTKADAIRAQYGAQITAMQARRVRSDGDAAFIRSEVAKLKAKQAEAVAKVEAEKAAALDKLLADLNAKTGRADAERERANGKTRTANEAEEQRHASDMQAVGAVSWVISVFFAVLFSLLVYASVRIRVKSGILPRRDFTGLDAHGSPWHKLGIAVQDAFSRQLHRFAVWLHRVLSAGARQLRDFDGKVIFIEPDDAGTLGGGSAIATAERNGARPIGFYRDRAGAPGDVDAGGETKNVPHTRADDFRTLVVTDANTRTCEHCGQPYIYRHAKQRFCSNECRVNAWENRTGKEIRRGAGGRL